MLRAAIYTIGAVLMLASTANADVYRYTDEKGNVQYTDRPLTLPAERLSIATQHSDVVAIDERVGEEAKAAADRDKAQQKAQKPQTNQAKTEEATAENKAEVCIKARQEYVARTTAQRLFEVQPNGERRYFSNEEIDAARASAKQVMDTMCN